MRDATVLALQALALPQSFTPIIGRDHDVAELRAMLVDLDQRLVTLTGPGGIGKTRLALHVALALQDEIDGDVAFVPLAPLRQPNLILPAIGQAFGIFGEEGNGFEDDLLAALRRRRVLLVLDNLEQIPGASAVIGRLLDRAPEVSILATSQTPLGLDMERPYPLAPLSTPPADAVDDEALQASDAVALFLARARAIDPHLLVDGSALATIATICRRLDGLPLAIELAAARSNVLSSAALLSRLETSLDVLGGGRPDLPDRLRTMRNAIAWSYELLDIHEQGLFRKLAVFTGGFSREAASAMLGADANRLLWSLVERSLVMRLSGEDGDERFLMLETLRTWGLERLAALGEEGDAHRAHVAYYVRLAEQAEPHLVGSEQAAWLQRLDREVENIRAAIDWSLGHGRREDVLRIGGAIWRYFSARGYLADCRRWLERALAVRGAGEPQHRAQALIGLGYVSEDLRDLDAAHAAFEQARYLAAAIGDRQSEARALTGLGTVDHDRGAYASAMELHMAAGGLSREAGDLRGVSVASGSMAAVSYFQGRLEDAVRHWEECLRIVEELGDTVTESQVLGNLGAASSEMGDFAAAKDYVLRALELQRRLNLQSGLPYTLINLGEAARQTGEIALARTSFAEALERLRDAGNGMVEGHALNGLARLELGEGNISEAAQVITESTHLVAEIGDRHSIIDNAEVVAMLCSARGHHAEALELLSAATAGRDEIGAEPTPAQVRERGEVHEAARSALGDDQAAAHLAAGQLMAIDALARRVMSIGRRIGARQPDQPGADVPAPSPEISERAHAAGLTRREVEVLTLLARGYTTRQLAQALSVSPRTAATHVNNILGKLDVSSRTAAVALALREGIIRD